MSTTTNVNISMPKVIREVMEKRMAEKGFENISEYIRDLIREDQRRAAQMKLEEELLEGERSGPVERADAEWWARLRAEVTEKFKKAKHP